MKGAKPFTDRERYDVSLGGRRCDIKSFSISYREQIAEMRRNPQVMLNAPALVPSEQNVNEDLSDKDIYLFPFLSGPIAASQDDLQKAIYKKKPYHLVHIMPETWMRPAQWNPLGALVLKSESAEAQVVEVNGQDEGRETRRSAWNYRPIRESRLSVDSAR